MRDDVVMSREASINPLEIKGYMFTFHVLFEVLRFQLAYFFSLSLANSCLVDKY